MSAAIAAVVVTYRSGATIDECLARLRTADRLSGDGTVFFGLAASDWASRVR